MFASVDLARRIESAELELVRALANAARERHPERDLLVRELAGGLAVWLGDGSPINKVVGLGFDGAVPVDELAEVEAMFAARNAPLHVELANLGDADVARFFTERGYRIVSFENVSGRPLGADAPAIPAPAHTVRVSAEAERESWLDLVAAGFAAPDVEGVASHESFEIESLRRILADFAAADGMEFFAAELAGELVGGASMRCTSGIAQLCGATTLSAARRRGVQTAMLHERLQRATDAGCDLAVVVTQPGSRSQQNVIRQGFRVLYTRTILARS